MRNFLAAPPEPQARVTSDLLSRDISGCFKSFGRRKNLVEGYSVHCALRSKGYGRDTVRGQLFLFPSTLILNLCGCKIDYLKKINGIHSLALPMGLKRIPLDGQISRKFKSRDNHDMKESWEIWRLDSGIKKLKSLVYLLNDRSDGFPAGQAKTISAFRKRRFCCSLMIAFIHGSNRLSSK